MKGQHCITTLDDCYEYHDLRSLRLVTFFFFFSTYRPVGWFNMLRNSALRERDLSSHTHTGARCRRVAAACGR